MTKYVFQFVLLAILINSNICKNECCFNSSFAYRDNQYILLSNFEYFSQLKFNCSQLTEMAILEFHSLSPLLLDHTLNLTGFRIRRSSKKYISILFNNLKGFDLNSNPFRHFKTESIIWQFINTKFDFYLHNNLMDNHLCTSDLSFSLIESMKILYLQKGTIFASEICPYIFKNALIYLIVIDRISSSFIEENLLIFQNETATTLNSSIYQLHLNFYHIDFNSRILNSYVFKKLKILDLNGPINSIQFDLFKSFVFLKEIRLRSQNVRKLFAKKNEWLIYLNLKASNRYDSFLLVIYQAFSNVSFYEYPDEDFCHFKSFPHRQFVLPMLKPTFKSKCTCLELFLIQFSAKSGNNILKLLNRETSIYSFVQYYSEIIFENRFSICVNSSFNESLLQCDFYKRLEICQIKQIDRNKDDFIFYVYDWIQMKNIIQTVFPKYINLVFSVLGIIVNITMIIILSNKKIMTDKMYTYLLINSYFNLVYCTIFTIRSIINHLVGDLHRLTFMPSDAIFVQYLYLIVIKFGSSFVRSCSNIYYFSFAFSRYIMISNMKSFLIEKFQRLTKANFFLLTLTVSIIINVHIVFQFKIQYSASISSLDPLHTFSAKNFSYFYKREPINDYKENFSSGSEYLILNVAHYAQMILSDLMHIIITTVIDMMLLVFIKKKIKSNQNLIHLNVSLEIMSRIQRVKQKRKSKKSKNRISQMIILNGINFLIFRLPLALLSFYGFFFKYNRETKSHEPSPISYIICKEKMFCASLQEIFMCFHLFSFWFQFFIFYKLDLNFKSSLLDIKKKFSYLKVVKI